MLGQDLGLGHDPGQHLAYVDSWIAALEKDPYEIVRACRDAEKIKQYVLGLEQTLERGTEQIGEQMREQGQSNSTIAENYTRAQETSTKNSLAQTSAPVMPSHAQPESLESAKPFSAHTPAAPSPHEKTYLAVPYHQKNQAKAAGARWDRQAKLWYALPGADLAKLEAWLPRQSPQATPTLSPQDEFARAIEAAGLDLGGQSPIMDGTIHRVPLQDAKPGRLDGAYLGYADGIPAGFIQNHKTGERITWKATGHVLTEDQKTSLKAEAQQRKQELERQRSERQIQAVQHAQAKLDASQPADPNHPYLTRKAVPAYDLRQDTAGNLLVPGYDNSGLLQTLQTISPDGTKRFEAGTRKHAAFHPIDPERKLGTPDTPILYPLTGSRLFLENGYL